MNTLNSATTCRQGYAPINGLKMYYEIEGTGDPLVFIPPAFGVAGMKTFPAFVQSRAVVTVDLQGYGRTADIQDRPLSNEQHAKDVIALLKHLGISKADFFGESYGGAIAAIIAVRSPEIVRRVATYGATFGPPQVAVNPEMLHTNQPPTPDSRSFLFQKENYKKVAPDPDYWPRFWDKIVSLRWDGFSREELASIKAPVLIAVGDHDFVRLEHAVETFKLIPNAELAVIPDAGHYALFSEQGRVIPVVEHFLNKPDTGLLIATAETGYHPGKTR
jgi:pimeloyl-ACP methyl ester carboxylesterase